MQIIQDPEKIDRKIWYDFVYQHPNGNIFQTPEMFDVYKNTKNYDCVFLAALRNENIIGVLLAVIQKEYSGLLGKLTARSIIFGGPLVDKNEVGIVTLLLNEYNKIISGKVIYTQVRNIFSQEDNKLEFEINGFTFIDHLNIILDLSIGADKLWSGCSKSRKKGIKKAYSGCLDFRIGHNGKYLDEFYNLLSVSYKRIGLPFPIKYHFKQIITILKPSIYKIFVISKNNDCIVALFALIYRNTMYGYYLGSTDNPELLKMKPMDLLFWEVFKWAVHNNIYNFDWMGAGKPDKKYGVRDFKMQYGGEPINLGRFEKIHKPALYTVSKFGLKLWKMTK